MGASKTKIKARLEASITRLSMGVNSDLGKPWWPRNRLVARPIKSWGLHFNGVVVVRSNMRALRDRWLALAMMRLEDSVVKMVIMI